MLQKTEKNYWDTSGYRRRDAPTVAGILGPASTIQLNKWLVDATVWAQSTRDEIGERSYASVIELIPYIAYFVKDGLVLEDGRQFSCFSSAQMLQATGWGPTAKKRLLRTCHICSLSATAEDSPSLAKACRNLRAAGLGPIIEPLHRGRKGSHGSVYTLVGIDPLPEPPAEEADEAPRLGGVDSGLGGVDSSAAPRLTPPQTPGLGGADSLELNAVSAALAAEISLRTDYAAPPDKAAFGGVGAEGSAPPSLFVNQYSFVVSGAEDAAATNDEKTIKEKKCFDALVSLFPRGVGRPEFACKARAAFDGLVARGADAEAVLERAKELQEAGTLPDFPLQLLQRHELFSDLFRAAAEEVVAWAASAGRWSESDAARRIYALRNRDPSPGGLTDEVKAEVWALYDAREAELQTAYAVNKTHQNRN